MPERFLIRFDKLIFSDKNNVINNLIRFHKLIFLDKNNVIRVSILVFNTPKNTQL